jgi:retinol dehydrogenase-12
MFWSSPLTIICQALLNKGAKVYIAARSKSRADSAIEWLKTETGGKTAIFLQLDLADLASVRRAVEEFKQYAPPSFYPF